MDRLTQIIGWLLAALLIAAVAINFSNVFSRYILDQPFSWGDEAMGFLQVALVVIGAALVTRANAHLRMDALEHFMSPRVKRWLDIAVCIVTVVVAVTVVVMSWRIAAGMFENDTRSVALDMPLGIPYSAFVVGFGLMALFAALRLAALLRRR
jgi:TRAP-type C4-dicarboxylate transport system permease small subunit